MWRRCLLVRLGGRADTVGLMRRALAFLIVATLALSACSSPPAETTDMDRDATVSVAAIYRNDDGTIRVERHTVTPAEVPALRAELASDPDVVVAGPDAVAHTQGTVAQVSLGGSQWALDRVGAPAAWAAGHTGEGVRVAVVDTGVDATHPDLAGRVTSVFSAFDSPATTDPSGHGTHVAGIVAAAQGAPPTTGVAPDARVLAVRVMGADGVGTHSNIAAGIIAAVDAGADVVNLSLGGPESTDVLASGVAYAVDRGVVVVAAAGNENTTAPSYPAAYPGVLAVAATTRSDARAPFSNTGPHLDLSAPGFAITSTVPAGHRDVLSGTSQAAPFVAGTAAVVIDSGVARRHVPARLVATAGPLGNRNEYGAGMVDASAATGGAATPPGMQLNPPTLPDLELGDMPRLDFPTVPDFDGFDRPRLDPQQRPNTPDLGPTPDIDLDPGPDRRTPDAPGVPEHPNFDDPTVERPDGTTMPAESTVPVVACDRAGVCTAMVTGDPGAAVTVRVGSVVVAGGDVSSGLSWRSWLAGPVVVTVDGVDHQVTVDPSRPVRVSRVGDQVTATSGFGPPRPTTVTVSSVVDGRWSSIGVHTGFGRVRVDVAAPQLVRSTVSSSGLVPVELDAWRPAAS